MPTPFAIRFAHCRISENRNTEGGLTSNCVRANFEPPCFRISLFGFRSPLGVTFVIGPKSKVILDASYCDDRLRIGKGASGVRFVLRRVEQGWDKDLWKRVVGSSFKVGKKGIVGGLVAAGMAGIKWGRMGGKIMGGLAVAMAAAIVKSTGGIEGGEQPEV